ncbi:M50 family metallopeptidase [Actinophytocola oryzae]|uniref:Peptidase M50B-like protein n=1 Tax=Actinophytocola oryzae TaxID=502181 RepID=A0A4R7VRZ7_9PSEU|nr:M50 family metallopeptidase [Actinophytocola oryzae]TDV52258.1 peptidase M50B-like protein [Actinophytocola oryzae]
MDFFHDQPATVVLVTGAAALVVVVFRELWRPARNVITIVHEAGHALVAVLAGRRLSGIRLHSDTSGLTLTRGKPYGPGMVSTALAGYVAPSLLGLGFAGLVGAEQTATVLVVCAVLLLGVLVMVRNVYGVFTVLLTGAVLFAVAWWTTPTVQAAFAYLITWFLLLGGVRPIGELQSKRRRGRARDSDADQLARLTGAPGWLWVAMFFFVNLGSLVLAAAWLLG